MYLGSLGAKVFANVLPHGRVVDPYFNNLSITKALCARRANYFPLFTILCPECTPHGLHPEVSVPSWSAWWPPHVLLIVEFSVKHGSQGRMIHFLKMVFNGKLLFEAALVDGGP